MKWTRYCFVLFCFVFFSLGLASSCFFIGPPSGLEIATDTVANATNIFSLATKNSSLVAKVATRFLYDLELKK